MRHLKDTIGYGIMFDSQQNDPSIVGYVDFDYVDDLDDKRSTIGYDDWWTNDCCDILYYVDSKTYVLLWFLHIMLYMWWW